MNNHPWQMCQSLAYHLIIWERCAPLCHYYTMKFELHGIEWLAGTEVSASCWGSGDSRFQSNPRLTFQSCSRYQLNQLGSKAASESTFKKSNNNSLYFLLYFFSVVTFTEIYVLRKLEFYTNRSSDFIKLGIQIQLGGFLFSFSQ